MPIETAVHNFRVLLAANGTGTITAPIPTATEPVNATGVAVIEMGDNKSRNQILLGFFGAGSANNAGTAMVYGWRRVRSTSAPFKVLYVPVPLLGLDVTLGTGAGIAGTAIDENQLFADTLAVTSGKEHTSAYELVSNANNEVALVKLDTFGCYKVEVRVDKGTATSLNGFVSEF